MLRNPKSFVFLLREWDIGDKVKNDNQEIK